MIAMILGGLAVVACLIWGATWVIQIAAVILCLAFRILVQVLAMACGVCIFIGMWITNRRPAEALLRRENARRRAHG